MRISCVWWHVQFRTVCVVDEKCYKSLTLLVKIYKKKKKKRYCTQCFGFSVFFQLFFVSIFLSLKIFVSLDLIIVMFMFICVYVCVCNTMMSIEYIFYLFDLLLYLLGVTSSLFFHSTSFFFFYRIPFDIFSSSFFSFVVPLE